MPAKIHDVQGDPQVADLYSIDIGWRSLSTSSSAAQMERGIKVVQDLFSLPSPTFQGIHGIWGEHGRVVIVCVEMIAAYL